jgi:parallel beta-helix repeat protein
MRWHHWFRDTLGQPQARRVSRSRPPGRGGLRPRLEQFEYRTLLSSYTAASVSDLINDINAANSGGGSNTITLAAKTNFTLTAVNNTTDGGNGLPVIAANDNLTIVGNGDSLQRDSKGPAFRLFDVATGASLTLTNLTVQNGLASGAGGGILNNGTLSVSGCTVSGNSAGSDGGGLSNFGTMTVQNSTLSGNSADGVGGGIDNEVGSITISGSTLSHNSTPGFGGGIYNGEANLDISGCTVSHNTATEDGGGIYLYQSGSVSIDNSVVCNNHAASGDDLFDFSPFNIVTISNSTVCVIVDGFTT